MKAYINHWGKIFCLCRYMTLRTVSLTSSAAFLYLYLASYSERSRIYSLSESAV
jgi:hypothetical protein